jgi:glycosyltransferase involved in cell wall biosynthesis
MDKRYHIGFVVPRYGEEILGGAEALARGLAEAVVAAGMAEVEVFTTCATDHMQWRNDLPPGRTQINGVTLYRFPVDEQTRKLDRYEALHRRLIAREQLEPDEQYEWVHTSAHSPQLYAHLERHAHEFDFLIFIPYLFGTTYYGTTIAPERSILWPCYHDEIYAYMQPTADVYHSCLGVQFNSYPEKRLAERIFGPHPGSAIVGFGLRDFTAQGATFRAEQGLGDRPILLYSGRLEGSKNVHLLLHYFQEYKRRRANEWTLVLMGQGPEPIPDHPDIRAVGFRMGQAKLDAYAAANLLCQPSINESFSIVIMESWLAGVPVLVHRDCDVTHYHALRSRGGLSFRTYGEFETALDQLLCNDGLQRRLGERGRAYVHMEYTWDSCLTRFRQSLDRWQALKQL